MLSFAETNFGPQVIDPISTALLTETRELLRDGLPDIELARLTARGASLSTRELVTLMRDAVESHRTS
jgi:hypothetical protein